MKTLRMASLGSTFTGSCQDMEKPTEYYKISTKSRVNIKINIKSRILDKIRVLLLFIAIIFI